MSGRVASLGVALVAGVLFGAGLAVAQMTNPAKVLAFLDVAGAWDPSLAFVMGGGVGVMALAWRRHGPLSGLAGGIDGSLLLGAALFGLGWGLVGLCPGPAIAGLVTGHGGVALFVVSMIAGIGLFRFTLVMRPDVVSVADADPPHSRSFESCPSDSHTSSSDSRSRSWSSPASRAETSK